MKQNKVIKCTCGAIFKKESFASAEAQFKCHQIITATGGKLTSNEHKMIVGKD